MATRRQRETEATQSPRRPAASTAARENDMISLAHKLAESRIRDGTASAQEIVHFLRLGSSRERLEQERMTRENALLEAKVESFASQQRIESMYKEAMDAFRSYSGHGPPVSSDDDYDD